MRNNSDKIWYGFKVGLVALLCVFFSERAMSQNNALFDQGKQQYKAEKYQEALNNWMKILENGEHSSALYFNIANAHYKLNSIGPSIYYYEKALQLAPGDKEVLNNLAFAENATVDAIEPLPKTLFAKWDNALSKLLTFDGWAWVTVIGSILFALFFISYYFSVYSMRKRIYFISSMFLILIIITGLSMSFRTFNAVEKDRPAIIMVESTDVKVDPSMKSESAFILHEGTKVQIIGEDEDWYRILLANGKDGWMVASDLKPL